VRSSSNAACRINIAIDFYGSETIDTVRAQLVIETLLEGIATHQAGKVIIDVTGVRIIDTGVAQVLIQAAQAARLLGTTVILTGIQPQIAQTLVQLGVDLQGIITHSTLQAGLLR
jgi:anti-anti-sigma regulatory factor